jgi:hypothetical protein
MATAVGKAWTLQDTGNGRGDMLPVSSLSWSVIPPFEFVDAYPVTIPNIKANYLNGGPAVASIEDVDSTVVGTGVVEYSDVTDAITVNSDPAGASVRMSADDGQSPSAEADWQARSSAPDVVWAHDFRGEDEVLAFSSRNGTPSNSVFYQTADGVTGGGCLQIDVPTGALSVGGWERPFSRLPAGENGKTQDDDPDGSSGVTQRTGWLWSPDSNIYDGTSTSIARWEGSAYGHTDYHPQGASPLRPDVGPSFWDGDDFYIQYRVKVPASRWTVGNPDGKLIFMSTSRKSNPDQELIIQSLNVASWQDGGTENGATGIYRMYTSRGGFDNSFLTDPQGGNSGAEIQPNGPFEVSCTIGDNTSGCWEWPADEWVTVLTRLKPGHNAPNISNVSDSANDGSRDTLLEVWVLPDSQIGNANYGGAYHDRGYMKLWTVSDYVWGFGGAVSGAYPEEAAAEGFNAMICSGFMNDVPAVAGWYHRYDQIIFSKAFVNPPTV